MTTKRLFDGPQMWACECGLLNWWADRQCRQCLGERAETWAEYDRRRYVTCRVWVAPNADFRDEEWYVPPGYYLHPAVVGLVHHVR